MKRILIVDDDPMVAFAVSTMLEEYELAAETAHSREDAEAMLANEFFPVILADLRLRSEEEGFLLLDSIRRLSPRSQVASMTGYATPDIDRCWATFRARGLFPLQRPVPAVAFGGRRIAWFMHDRVPFELVEQGPPGHV